MTDTSPFYGSFLLFKVLRINASMEYYCVNQTFQSGCIGSLSMNLTGLLKVGGIW